MRKFYAEVKQISCDVGKELINVSLINTPSNLMTVTYYYSKKSFRTKVQHTEVEKEVAESTDAQGISISGKTES